MEVNLQIMKCESSVTNMVNIKHTAAYRPWSNELNEHNHAIIYIIMKKMLEGLSNDESMALLYAVSVRNGCLYVHGFTPVQLSTEQNPRVLSTFHYSLLALEGCTTSSIIVQSLNAIAAAHKAFVQAETSAKEGKALIYAVRKYCDVVFKPNNNAFYKLPTDPQWQGAATCIGIDSKIILIKHGSVLKHVHPSQLELVPFQKLIGINPVDSENLYHPNDIECSVPTIDNNIDSVTL